MGKNILENNCLGLQYMNFNFKIFKQKISCSDYFPFNIA
jgi:hypothetical protein